MPAEVKGGGENAPAAPAESGLDPVELELAAELNALDRLIAKAPAGDVESAYFANLLAEAAQCVRKRCHALARDRRRAKAKAARAVGEAAHG